MKARLLLVVAALVVSPATGVAQEPPIDRDGLVTSGYGHMHMLLEKTVLNIDVLDLDLYFGEATAAKIGELAGGQEYSEDLGNSIAKVALRAPDVHVVSSFKRDVTYEQFIDGVEETLGEARDAGLINEKTFKQVMRRVKTAFGVIAERGIKKGDKLIYRASDDSLRTVLVKSNGDELVDETDSGSTPRVALLAGYFAPGTDTREPLIKSIFPD